MKVTMKVRRLKSDFLATNEERGRRSFRAALEMLHLKLQSRLILGDDAQVERAAATAPLQPMALSQRRGGDADRDFVMMKFRQMRDGRMDL